MRRFIRNTASFLTVLMVLMTVFTLKPHAAVIKKKLELKVNTVIDNIDELPSSMKSKTFYYGAKRITKMNNGSSSSASYPSQVDTLSFPWEHGGSKTISFDVLRSLYYNLLWFGSNSSTESNISLENVVCNSNLRNYTYNDGGRGKAITPYNWLEIINNNAGSAEVTLHFKYNPNIDEIPMEEPDIQPGYSKRVDYLGDKESEAGSATDKVNYYRLYLDFNPGEDWREEDNERDIVFVLDVSTSMEEKLGKSTRFKVLKDTLGMAINRLTTNAKNKISIVTFGTRANTLITGENDKQKLTRIINNLTLPGGDAGGTNFYEAME
ncbi:MAG TPA: VWA domain-containing protein, partial [Clostridia bacterium]|nr:VWA domain-containing protein [Clostridia bacterium]